MDKIIKVCPTTIEEYQELVKIMQADIDALTRMMNEYNRVVVEQQRLIETYKMLSE